MYTGSCKTLLKETKVSLYMSRDIYHAHGLVDYILLYSFACIWQSSAILFINVNESLKGNDCSVGGIGSCACVAPLVGQEFNMILSSFGIFTLVLCCPIV